MKWAIGFVIIGAIVWWHGAIASAATADEPGTEPPMPHDPIDPATESSGTQALAHAIATAEGFGVPGAIPTRAHNPGDLVIPGWTGAKLGGEGISVFATDADGWGRLFRQLDLIGQGRSRVYTLDDTIAEFAHKWTATQQAEWTDNVLASLQAAGFDVSEDTTLRELLG